MTLFVRITTMSLLCCSTFLLADEQSAAQQALELQVKRIEQQVAQHGVLLSFEELDRLRVKLMAEQLKQTYPQATIEQLVEQSVADYQLDDVSQQRLLIIYLHTLEDDGAGIIPPE